MKKALVGGAGGFIGGHLVKRLLAEGYTVRAVDIKPRDEWHQLFDVPDLLHNASLDLSTESGCVNALSGEFDEVYNLAADMGGMGFIETHKYECMQSVLINTNLLNAAIAAGVSKYFYASSACVYPGYMQNDEQDDYWAKKGGYWRLKESDAYPADPEDGYGWEKLFSERMCRHAYEDRGLEVRVARYHNVYGPHGTWTGGREKAPAAMCRKIAEAVLTHKTEIDIWGDGEQTRSFMYVADCIEGTRRLMESNHTDPINIGSSELVTVNELARRVEERAMSTVPLPWVLEWVYDLNAPQGVRGRNSDNTLIKQVLGWEPSTSLDEGLDKTYSWVYDQVRSAHANDVHGSVVR